MLPETWTAGVACTGISSGVITALRWKPLKKLQRFPSKKDDSSDLIGYEFVTESDLAMNKPGSKRYSGITWRVEIDCAVGDRHYTARVGEFGGRRRVQGQPKRGTERNGALRHLICSVE